MKNLVHKRALGSLVAGLLVLSSATTAITASAAQTLRTTSQPGNDRKEGWYNNYHHEIWQADTPNSSTMTLHDNDGGFSTQWQCGPNNSRGNFLARRGLFWDLNNPKTWKDYDDFYCDFDCNWSAGSSGNSRICIYGWAQNPLVEYYIIEDWKNWSPAQDPNAKYKGSFNCDGSEYKVYTCDRNSYTIEGDNKNFTQYISIRQNTRTSGTISISEHFRNWERFGMRMGNFYEVAFNVEGWESDGKADVNLTLTEGRNGNSSNNNGNNGNNGNSGNNGNNGNSGNVSDPIEGTLYTGTFENGTDYWQGRGSAKAASSSSKAFEGSKSLYISGRQNNWNGAELALDSNYFKAGQAYSFSTKVMPTTSTTVQLSMQYDQYGSTKYTQVASAKATAGQWTLLENSNFTIPSGASNVKIYVEAPDSLTDMYIDQAICASAGYKAPTSQSSGNNNSGNNNSGNNNSGNSGNNNTASAETGNLFTSTFENGTDYWAGRGSAKVSSSSSKAYAGSKSLYVTGRQNNWNGAAIELDKNYFKAGSTYAFSAEVQPSTSTTVQLSLQYDQNGSTKYAQVASAKASAGKWTKLENTEYTIPSGASNCILYVEAPDSLTDMYIDQVTANTTDAASSNNNQSNNQQSGNNNVDTSKKLVAISFDDGTGVAGQRITDALISNGFHATFFYVGNWITNEDQVRYAYKNGMEIANHTTSHNDLTQMSSWQIRQEFDNTQSKLRNIIGAEPAMMMRLPYLSSNWQVQQALNDVALISCAVDSEDWKGISSDQIVGNIQNAARNGSLEGAIVLCHENQANTAAAMETVLPWLKANGYEVVTISDMFAAKGQTLQGGQVYTRVS